MNNLGGMKWQNLQIYSFLDLQWIILGLWAIFFGSVVKTAIYVSGVDMKIEDFKRKFQHKFWMCANKFGLVLSKMQELHFTCPEERFGFFQEIFINFFSDIERKVFIWCCRICILRVERNVLGLIFEKV